VTTTLTDVPDVAEGVKTHPRAVPAFEKSLLAIPETDSLNVTPNDKDIADAGDEGVEEIEAVGRSTSIFIVEDVVASTGPVCDVINEVTESWATVRTTLPEVTLVPLSSTT
jgi:hypothetical protein